jgi:catechol 2,3-dioxygenase-like lactoylglutathione lyase family enzyme
MAAFTYDHIHLRSPDAEATARWYEEMFGAEIIRSVQSDGRPRLDLNLGGVAVFIAQVPPEQAVAAPPEPPYLGARAYRASRDRDRSSRRRAQREGRGVHGRAQDDQAGGTDRLSARSAKCSHRAIGQKRRLSFASSPRFAGASATRRARSDAPSDRELAGSRPHRPTAG